MSKSSQMFMNQRELESIESTPVKSNITLNKASLMTKVKQITQEVNEGRVNPLEAFVFLNWMAKVAEGAKNQLLEQAIVEAEKYPEKETNVYDAKITVRNGGGKYDYSGIEEIVKKEVELKALIEDAKAAYKSMKSGNQMVNEDTGEIIESAKFNPNKQTIAITFE